MLADKVTEFFVEADDFCLEFEVEIKRHLLESKENNCRFRKSQLSDAEIISILLLFHFGQFSNFKAFYTQYVCVHLIDLFPDLVSYQRFVALKKKVAMTWMMPRKKGLVKYKSISYRLNSSESIKLHRNSRKRLLLQCCFLIVERLWVGLWWRESFKRCQPRIKGGLCHCRDVVKELTLREDLLSFQSITLDHGISIDAE